MNCNEICDKLSLYIDNELGDEEMRQMEEHIKSCVNCQKEMEEYENLISVLQSLPEEEPPEGYCARLHEKLLENGPQLETRKEASKIKKINRFKWMKYGSIAAALVLVFLVGNMNSGKNNFGIKSKTESSYDMAATEENKAVAPQAIEPAEAPEGYSDQIAEEIRGEASANDSVMLTSLKAEREMKIIKTGAI